MDSSGGILLTKDVMSFQTSEIDDDWWFIRLIPCLCLHTSLHCMLWPRYLMELFLYRHLHHHRKNTVKYCDILLILQCSPLLGSQLKALIMTKLPPMNAGFHCVQIIYATHFMHYKSTLKVQACVCVNMWRKTNTFTHTHTLFLCSCGVKVTCREGELSYESWLLSLG